MPKEQIKFKFKEGASVASSDWYYDLSEGYIKPSKLLEDKEQAKKVVEALNLIDEFLSQASAAGAIEEM